MEQMITPPERPGSPPRRQRACMSCTKAKARCHFPEDSFDTSGACERCQRVGIKCTAKSTKSLRKPRQIKPLNNRVSTLEQRLDELTRTLQAKESTIAQLVTSQGSPPNVVQTPQSTISSTSRASDATRGVDLPSRPGQPSRSAAGVPFGLTWYQAEIILKIYREEFFPNFPFVVIPDSITPVELLTKKPALFRAVMLACAPLSISRLEKMKRSVLAYLSQHIIVDGDRNLELLQALLVVLAWVDLGGLYDQQITNLTFMAVGYAHNLDITKIPRALLRKIGLDDGPEDFKSYKNAETKTHSADEQRSFLGCYCLASINSTQFGRLNSLSGQYVELCCESLGRNKEYETDYLVIHTVRMIHIGERIAESFGAAVDSARGRPFLFLLGDHVSSMRAELDALSAAMSEERIRINMPSIHEDEVRKIFVTYTAHYQYLLVRLYEPATYLKPTAEETADRPSYRLESLQSCLRASKDFYNFVTRLTTSYLRCMPVTQISQITVVLVITTRLLLIDGGPYYDIAEARRYLDFSTILEKLESRVSGVEEDRVGVVASFARETGIPQATDDDAMSKFADTAMKTSWIKQWYSSRIAEKSVAPNGAEVVNSVFEWQPPGMDGLAPDTRPPSWFGGLLENTYWNFDEMPQ